MKTTTNQHLNATDRALLEKVQEVFTAEDDPVLLGNRGRKIQLPSPLSDVLAEATRALLSGRSVQLTSSGEVLSSQAAADDLGCSRVHLVKLLDDGQIPFHYVGTHRRVLLQDLETFKLKRDKERRGSMARLTQIANDDQYAETGEFKDH